ncbi:DUF317 domain-containing protein [Streptomyces sp. NPDC051561]|uniref:DUF317 domain-containing protein n=1 Tax=Streptomyces sp. NPDC051561 TaxID=3365658 RepID=UPI00378BEE1E
MSSRHVPYIFSNANRMSYQNATSPRHAAGMGDPRHITRPLRAAGWHNYSELDFPQVVLASPDEHHTLVLDPEPNDHSAWWRIQAQLPGNNHWHVSLGGATPVEVIAGFTDALIRPEPAKPPEPDSLWVPFVEAGWTFAENRDGDERTGVHPDGIMHMRCRADDFDLLDLPDEGSTLWDAEARVPTGDGGYHSLWRAYFSVNTPLHLLAGFAGALASTEPVQRPRYEVPDTSLVTQVRTGPQSEELLVARRKREAQARAVGRAERAARTVATRQPGASSARPHPPHAPGPRRTR